MEETTTKTPNPPYLAFKTFQNFINGFRQAGLPARIDRTVMAGQSGATQSSLMLTLKYFGLIQENGTPTPALVNLVEHPETETKQYADLARRSYPFIFSNGLNLETATDGQLQEAFRAAGLGGETIRKGLTFFVMMADAAGIKISPHVKSAKNKAAGNGAAPQRPRRRRPSSSAASDDGDADDPSEFQGGMKSHVVPLDKEGTRSVRITAPLDMTDKEIRRLQKWMEVTLFVGWEEADE
ncbi:MAG: DUF5343 domain-containing protein [Opitutaceae bacterium]|nr:DUF5343 domain-containing protein [Opitutaceae bacterium]